MVKSYDDLKEKSLGMIAFFETSNSYPECYGVTVGNFDGAYVSHGVLQYNFKTGSLQPLWNHLNDNYNQLCRDIFGADYEEWANLINADATTQIDFGNKIMDTTNKHKIIEPWRTYFMQLGTSEPSIQKQVEMSSSWRNMGEIWFNRLGLYSRRGYALMFDIAVQMGRLLPQNLIWMDFQNIDPTNKTMAEIEEEKLRIIVQRCSGEENNVFPSETLPNLPQIVYNRKIAIVNGTSTVGFNIENYDLGYEPALKGGIVSG